MKYPTRVAKQYPAKRRIPLTHLVSLDTEAGRQLEIRVLEQMTLEQKLVLREYFELCVTLRSQTPPLTDAQFMAELERLVTEEQIHVLEVYQGLIVANDPSHPRRIV